MGESQDVEEIITTEGRRKWIKKESKTQQDEKEANTELG